MASVAAADFSPQRCNGCWEFKCNVYKLQCNHTLCMNCIMAQKHINPESFVCQIPECEAEYYACEYLEEDIANEYFKIPRHVDTDSLFEQMCGQPYEVVSGLFHKFCKFTGEQHRVYVDHLQDKMSQAQEYNHDLVLNAQAIINRKDDKIAKLKRNLYKMQLALQNAEKEREIDKMDITQIENEKKKMKGRSNGKIKETMKQKIKPKMQAAKTLKCKETSNDCSNDCSNDGSNEDKNHNGSSSNSSSLCKKPKLPRSAAPRPKTINPRLYYQKQQVAAAATAAVTAVTAVEAISSNGGVSKNNNKTRVNSESEIEDNDIEFDVLLNDLHEFDEPPKKKAKLENNEKTKSDIIYID